MMSCTLAHSRSPVRPGGYCSDAGLMGRCRAARKLAWRRTAGRLAAIIWKSRAVERFQRAFLSG